MPDQPSTPDTDGDRRDFAAFIFELARGKTHRELSEALREVSRGVLQTGKPGKIQLSLTFKQQKNVEGALLITDNVTVSTPSFDRPASIFYATDEGDLHRNDPRQPSLFQQITQETPR